MKIVSSKLFNENTSAYFDLADKEDVIVRTNSNKLYALAPLTQDDIEDKAYFSDPVVIESIDLGIAQIKSGKGVRLTKSLKDELFEL